MVGKSKSEALNDLAGEANLLAFQLYLLENRPQLLENEDLKRALRGGLEVCEVLSEGIDAVLNAPLESHKLDLVDLLAPILQDLLTLAEQQVPADQKLPQLKEKADSIFTVVQHALAKLEKGEEIGIHEFGCVKEYFTHLEEIFLKAATELLLHSVV